MRGLKRKKGIEGVCQKASHEIMDWFIQKCYQHYSLVVQLFLVLFLKFKFSGNWSSMIIQLNEGFCLILA